MSGRRRYRLHGEAGGCLGELLSELWRDNHITEQQYNIGMVVYTGLRRVPGGTSAGLVGSARDKVDTSVRPLAWPTGVIGDMSVDLISAVVNKLRGHELRTLQFMVTYRERPRGKLEDMQRQGVYKSGRLKRAATIGRISALLDSLGELLQTVWVLTPGPYSRYVPSAHHPPEREPHAA